MARADVALAALTRSEAGSLILRGAETVVVAAEPAQVVDTTGAGDAYGAGFLAGLTAGRDLAACGRIASLAAAEVIGQHGARPRADLPRADSGGLSASAAPCVIARSVAVPGLGPGKQSPTPGALTIASRPRSSQ